MSQIPRSQFALKKRQNASPMVTIPVLDIETKTKKTITNGSSNGNGHKHGSFDNEVVIIEDCFVVREEVVVASEEVAVEETSPKRKPRSRKSKDSTESKLSEAVMTEESQGDDATAPEKETKILKMNNEELLTSKRRSGRSDRVQNASTIVNLSSVSLTDQSTVVSDDTPTGPERRVSGRRSTRPIDEIKYTYRTPNPDDSLNGTTNATIGSDVNNDSMLTTPGTDRKRRPINESTENLDSPKRSRLDLSGLFSSFSSPVAMLRNRFKRTNIASTPVTGGVEALLNDSLDTTAGDEMKEIDLNAKEVSTEVAAAPEEEEELKVITTPLKKHSCSVM